MFGSFGEKYYLCRGLIFKHMKYYVETKTLGFPWAIERTFDTYESAKRYVNNMRGFLAMSNTKIRISL